ncbi:hypothetical protein P8452_70579 [Trifolium repens]|nr:hypothetical protein P8452_70579 [Trifolium repens]
MKPKPIHHHRSTTPSNLIPCNFHETVTLNQNPKFRRPSISVYNPKSICTRRRRRVTKPMNTTVSSSLLLEISAADVSFSLPLLYRCCLHLRLIHFVKIGYFEIQTYLKQLSCQISDPVPL